MLLAMRRASSSVSTSAMLASSFCLPRIDVSERLPCQRESCCGSRRRESRTRRASSRLRSFSGWRLRCRFKRRLFICFMPCVAKLSGASLMVAVLPLFLFLVCLVNFIEGVRNLVQKH
jgi:hypothetical protein